MMAGLLESNAIIVGVVGLIILVIVIAAIAKNWRKGLKWIIGFIIAGIMAYLFASGGVLGIS